MSSAEEVVSQEAVDQLAGCICNPKIGGFVYNCPVHAKHVMLQGKPAHEATAEGRKTMQQLQAEAKA